MAPPLLPVPWRLQTIQSSSPILQPARSLGREDVAEDGGSLPITLGLDPLAGAYEGCLPHDGPHACIGVREMV